MERVDIEQLARELKVVLDVGLRPPKLRARLKSLPTLAPLASPGIEEADGWAVAAAVGQMITGAVESLGDGPYGQAVADLLGTRAATRGLPKHRRRAAAADDLETEVATFVRHWERDILRDVACVVMQCVAPPEQH